ncbi:MAG: class I SAM-dependent methyltransferase [Hyphomicrobiales bacterium]|nr:class I SAM-dependent methyltransferase [Hyphomicrobiales bacterium]
MAPNSERRRGIGPTEDDALGDLEGGMVYYRQKYLAEYTGVADPHAHLFVTKSIRRRAGITFAADRRIVPLSMARYERVSRRMTVLADRIDQFLILGVGYDTRPLWLPALLTGSVRVIEVDSPDKIEWKIKLLRENGISYPEYADTIGADLGSRDLPDLIVTKGFDPSRPTAVFMEGVVFQLPTKVARRLLSPSHLGLAPGSEVTFDFWNNARIDRRNEELRLGIGRPMFSRFPLPASRRPDEATDALRRMGYGNACTTPLAELVRDLWPNRALVGSTPEWLFVTATVGG